MHVSTYVWVHLSEEISHEGPIELFLLPTSIPQSIHYLYHGLLECQSCDEFLFQYLSSKGFFKFLIYS